MALTVTTVAVPFPAGVEPVAPAGSVLGVVLTTADLPDAELTLYVANDQGTPEDYRQVFVNNRPLVFPVGRGGYFAVPAGAIPAGAKIQVGLTNFGSATADVNVFSE